MRKLKYILLATILCGYNIVSLAQTKVRLPESKTYTMEKVLLTGPAYKALRSLEGNWNVEMRVYPDAGAKPIISYMVARRVLSGHFLMEIMTARPGSKDAKFNRTAYFNYNNAGSCWEYIVLDSRYPVMMFETSKDTAQTTRELTLFLPSFITPPGENKQLAGKDASERRTISFVSPDKTITKQYWTLTSKPEYLAIEYTYTRTDR